MQLPIAGNQKWFTKLPTLLIEEPIWLPSSEISLTFSYRATIPSLPKTKLMACQVFGIDYKSNEFRTKLQTSLNDPVHRRTHHATRRIYQKGYMLL